MAENDVNETAVEGMKQAVRTCLENMDRKRMIERAKALTMSTTDDLRQADDTTLGLVRLVAMTAILEFLLETRKRKADHAG